MCSGSDICFVRDPRSGPWGFWQEGCLHKTFIIGPKSTLQVYRHHFYSIYFLHSAKQAWIYCKCLCSTGGESFSCNHSVHRLNKKRKFQSPRIFATKTSFSTSSTDATGMSACSSPALFSISDVCSVYGRGSCHTCATLNKHIKTFNVE